MSHRRPDITSALAAIVDGDYRWFTYAYAWRFS
jgi:hypothetical protein